MTEARVGTGTGLMIGGALSATADHHGTSTTTARGAAEGTDAAVGVAIALGFVDDSAYATLERDLTAGGAVSLMARGDGSSKAEAVASAAGTSAAAETDNGNATADDQAGSATGVANQQSGRADTVDENSVGQSANTDSEGDGGDSVGVGAALGLNVASSIAVASVGDVTINAVGALSLQSTNNMDAQASGDGSAVISGSQSFDPASGMDSDLDAGAETIELDAGHGLSTGDKVTYVGADSGDGAIGLTSGTDYYVNVAGDRVKLYDTQVNAEAGGDVATGGLQDLSNPATASGTYTLELGAGGGEGTAIGIGIAINVADMENRAVVDTDADVTAAGVSLTAGMKDVGGDTVCHQTHRPPPLRGDQHATGRRRANFLRDPDRHAVAPIPAVRDA